MGDVSPELNQVSLKNERVLKGRTNKLTSAVKKVAGKVILGTPLAALLISSSSIENPNIPAPNIKEPTPAVAPLPENTIHNTDILQPYTPQPPTETSTLTPIPDTSVDIQKTSKAEKEFIDRMKSKYGLDIKLYRMFPGAKNAVFGIQTLTEDEIDEIERSLSLMPYCPKNFYNKLVIGKVPKGEPYFGGLAQYPFGYIELNILGDRNHMEELLGGKTFQVQEILGKVLAHECGHMINYRIMHLSNTRYSDTPDGRINFYKDMQKIAEDKNPFYIMLAKLTNWQLDGAKYKKISPDSRIKSEAYNASIDEFMAEMFAMFKYRPDLLTKQESTFFKNLENGVSKEGDRFLKKVIENPKILLESQFDP